MWKFNETDNLPGNSLYHSADELYHYGVLGMRWRHRKAQWQQIRDAKKAYRQRNGRIQDKYFKSLENIEKGYKRGQTISKNDLKKENKLDSDTRNAWKKSKVQLKSDIKKAKEKYNKNVSTSLKNKYEAKAILKEAKARYKLANKQYNKDFNKASTLYGAWGPGNKERTKQMLSSLSIANKEKKNYKKAKNNYTKFKKQW